jgi:vacuolar-type H+-ATPase subunit E/Vma4
MLDWLTRRLLRCVVRDINAHTDARFARLEKKMADDTQSILDAIDAEDAEIERVKNAIAGEFQALKDQINSMPGPNVNKDAVLARITASTQKITGVDPGATVGSGGSNP